MRQYGLSKSKISSVLRRPDRKETGIVEGTIAVMQTNKSYSTTVNVSKNKRAPGEIWIMYKDAKDARNIISAWRYPGTSSPGETIPIPDDIRRELLET